MSINHCYVDIGGMFSPDDLNCRIVRFLLVQSVDKFMERLVRRRLKLGQIVAQVWDLVYRIFTFKRAEKAVKI